MIMRRLYSFLDLDLKKDEKIEIENKKLEVEMEKNKNEMGFIEEKVQIPDNPNQTIISPKYFSQDSFILKNYSEKNVENKELERKMEYQNHNLKVLLNIGKKSRKEEMSLSFLEFLKIKFNLSCKMTRREKLFAVAFKEFPKKLDAIEIIQKINEIDKQKLY